MEAAKSLPQAKPLPPTFEKLIEELPGLINQELPVVKQSNATEPSGDIVALGDTSIEEIEKLMEELRIARDYLRETGIEAICLPAFIDVIIENEDRTAIRLVVEPR